MSLAAIRERLERRRAELRALSVAVLCGGAGAEREVSLNSGQNVHAALRAAGFHSYMLPLDRDGLSIDRDVLASLDSTEAARQLESCGSAPDAGSSLAELAGLRQQGIVFTTMHGRLGEDGSWQGLLELLGLPYVSAGVLGSALAFDKVTTKRLMERFSVPTPRYWVQRRREDLRLAVPAEISDLVAKPSAEGSSVGIEFIANDEAGWARISELNARYEPLLIEERIRGAEITCGVIGHAGEAIALPLIEIRPHSEFYSYEAKYTQGGSEYICPAVLDERLAARIAEQSLLLYRELELAPYARFDCIVDALGVAWFLEVNTLPGFTEHSLLPKAARAAGIEFGELLEILLLLALERREGTS